MASEDTKDDLVTYKQLVDEVHVNGGISLSLAMAQETGVIKLLCAAEGSLSSADLASQGRLKERYVRNLLNALAVGGVIQLEPGTGGKDGVDARFQVPQAHRKALTKAAVGSFGISSCARHFAAAKDGFKLDKSDGAAESRHGHHHDHHGHHHDHHGHHHDHDHKLHYDTLEQWAAVVQDNITEAIFKTPGLKQLLEDGIDAVEVGCGPGNIACSLAVRFPDSRFTVTDIIPHALERAKQRAESSGLKNVTFELVDVCQVPDEWTERFDWLLAQEVMHHAEDPLQACKGIFKALKPGGHFSLVDEFVSSYVAENIGNKKAAPLYMSASFMCAMDGATHSGLGPCWGEETARGLVTSAGLEIEGMIRSGDLGTTGLLMCRKPTKK